MSTVAEIEEAIGALPPEQWAEIRRWLDTHAPKVPLEAEGEKMSLVEVLRSCPEDLSKLVTRSDDMPRDIRL